MLSHIDEAIASPLHVGLRITQVEKVEYAIRIDGMDVQISRNPDTTPNRVLY